MSSSSKNDFAGVFMQYQLLKSKMITLCDIFDNIMYELQYILSNKLEFQFSMENMVGTVIELQDFESILYSCKKCLEYTVLVRSKLVYTGDDFVLITKIFMIKEELWRHKLKLMNNMSQLVYNVLPLFVHHEENEFVVNFILRLCNLYNGAMKMDAKLTSANSNKISSNTYPTLLQPPKKIDIRALLQAIAKGRAEFCCHSLINCLLTQYTPNSGYHDDRKMSSVSDNSDVEIYRALTRHMTPPAQNPHDFQTKDPHARGNHAKSKTHLRSPEPTPEKCSSDSELNQFFDKMNTEMQRNENDDILYVNVDSKSSVNKINDLIEKEELSATRLLKQANQIASSLFEKKLTRKDVNRYLEYYTTALWSEVGVFLEHIVLWWGSAPLAARPPSSSQHLREWITQQRNNGIPDIIMTSLNSFADTLGCHVTATSWDKQFRMAVVGAAGESKRHTQTPVGAGNISKGTETGRLLSELLFNLVSLSNQCEVTNEYLTGAPVEELPLVEQIPVLHRLDHSIHTTRLWAANETRKLANDWNVEKFFLVTERDIATCLEQLTMLKLPNANVKIIVKPTDVHVNVCVNLKEKLLSEIKININKLKKTKQECIDVLAVVCRTNSLANLTLLFPRSSYWQAQQYKADTPSHYVKKYLDRILLPVLDTSDEASIGNLVLKIMCEAWLDHIYANRIRFSHGGALQLLTDFASVADWIDKSSNLSDIDKAKMAKNEILRQCEGVGRLLLRSPDEHIDMAQNKELDTNNSPEDSSLMPPEMFVPNQQQWLELRATKKNTNCGGFLLCCTITNV